MMMMMMMNVKYQSVYPVHVPK